MCTDFNYNVVSLSFQTFYVLKFKTKYFSDMKEIVRLPLKENVEETLAKKENLKKFYLHL